MTATQTRDPSHRSQVRLIISHARKRGLRKPDVRKVRCPRCGSEADCAGRPPGQYHWERWDAALRQRAARL
jgi:hypothetical protein